MDTSICVEEVQKLDKLKKGIEWTVVDPELHEKMIIGQLKEWVTRDSKMRDELIAQFGSVAQGVEWLRWEMQGII